MFIYKFNCDSPDSSIWLEFLECKFLDHLIDYADSICAIRSLIKMARGQLLSYSSIQSAISYIDADILLFNQKIGV